jgi:hypothetical protein
MKHRPIVVLAVLLVGVAVVAGITLGVTTLLGVTFKGTGEAQPAGGSRAAQASPSSSERGPLAICIQAVGADLALDSSPEGAALQAEAKSSIETALIEVAKHPYWESAGLAAAPPAVDIGCPSGPPPLEPEKFRRSVVFVGHVVSEPSGYDPFVLILPPEQVEEIWKYGGPRKAPHERMVEGDIGSLVTQAVYVRADEIQDPAFLAWLLEAGIGFETGRASGPDRWAGFEAAD